MCCSSRARIAQGVNFARPEHYQRIYNRTGRYALSCVVDSQFVNKPQSATNSVVIFSKTEMRADIWPD